MITQMALQGPFDWMDFDPPPLGLLDLLYFSLGSRSFLLLHTNFHQSLNNCVYDWNVVASVIYICERNQLAFNRLIDTDSIQIIT